MQNIPSFNLASCSKANEMALKFQIACNGARTYLSHLEVVSDPDQLRKLANDVQADSSSPFSRLNRVDEARCKTADGILWEMRRAAAIIDQIPLRVELERKFDRNFTFLMNLTPSDFRAPAGAHIEGMVSADWLVGAAKEVWEYLSKYSDELMLEPRIEQWDDVRNIYNGHIIGVRMLETPPVRLSESHLEPNDVDAQTLIDQIPLRCTLEAQRGSKYAMIMSIDPAKHIRADRDTRVGVATYDDLCGNAKSVFDYCRDKNLDPEIHYWSNLETHSEGFNIVAHWSESWKKVGSKLIIFNDPEGDNAWLSNRTSRGFTALGRHWKSVEHFFQAHKFWSSDPKWFDTVAEAESGNQARDLGRSREHDLRSDWLEVRKAVMCYAILSKFAQNTDLRNKLLSTADKVLVEDNPNNPFWGRGAEAEGINALGIIAMEVRRILKENPDEVEKFLKRFEKQFL